MKVADAMTPRADLKTVKLPGSRDDVLQYLQEFGFSSVPVVKKTADDGEEYRGLVSRDDLIDNPNEDDLALLMREVPTTLADTTVEEAAHLMVSEGARRVPVVTENDHTELAGIVTITDVIRAIARGEVDGATEVGDICATDVNATYEGTPLPVAEREIALANVPYTIALDDEGEMSGILTEVDIVAVAEVVEGEDDSGASLAEEDDDWKWEGIKSVGNRYIPTRNVEFPSEPISEFMTKDLVTVSRRKTAKEAAKLMISKDIEQIPVVSGGDLVGVVRDINLLEAV